MREFSRSFHYGGLSIKNELRQVHLYVVLLVVFFIIRYCFGGLADFLAENGDRMNIFELYVHFMDTRYSQVFYLLGIIAFSCGTFFYSHGAAYYLIRGSRRGWVLGQAVYLLVMVTGYNLFILSTLCLFTGGRLTLVNEWSMASFLAEQYSASSIGIMPVISVSYSTMLMSPVTAGLLTFLLSVLVGMAAGLVVICSSIRAKGVFGVAVLGITWFADFLIEDSAVFARIWMLSPFGVSRLGRLLSMGRNTEVLYGVIYFCILIAAEFYVLLKAAEKIDFVKLE